MSTKYEELFEKMDKLGAIRKDWSPGLLIKLPGEADTMTYLNGTAFELTMLQPNGVQFTTHRPNQILIIGHPPVWSDFVNAMTEKASIPSSLELGRILGIFSIQFNPVKPFFRDQSVNVINKALSLLG